MMETLNFSKYDGLDIQSVAIPVPSVRWGDSPDEVLKGFGGHRFLPLVDGDNRFIGSLRDVEFLNNPQAFFSGAAFSPSSEQTRLGPLDTVGDARKIWLSAEEPSLIPIVDRNHRYTGRCASFRAWIKLVRGGLTPPRIGGLATPLGVYMTTGNLSSGAGVPGLIATGAAFGVLAVVVDWVYMLFFSGATSLFPLLRELNDAGQLILQLGFMMTALLATIRLTPISGLHAAEHMTINAMENGLEITPEKVRTQPREHVRCGTNIMILLAGIQIAWVSLETLRPFLSPVGSFLYMLMWLLLIGRFWRKAGRWLQTHFTTKPPTDAQLESGLKAGRELMEKFNATPHPSPNIFQRLWGAGLIQILVSFLVTTWFFSTLGGLLLELFLGLR